MPWIFPIKKSFPLGRETAQEAPPTGEREAEPGQKKEETGVCPNMAMTLAGSQYLKGK